MDNYCVGDLNHLDDTSVNLFDPKDSTIKNEKYIYFKTEDCKIEENDVPVSNSTHGVIETLTACKSTDGVANLKSEFIPKDYVPDETVAVKIEKTEHTLEFGTIQELEHIFREYNENLADEGTETSQISKIPELDKTNGKKARRKTRDQKGKVQTNTLDTFLHKAIGGVKNRKRNVSDRLFVGLERIDISNKLLANWENSTSSTTRTNNENNLGTDQETSEGLELNKLPKQVGNSHQLNIKKCVEDMEQQEIDIKDEVTREYKCHDCNKVLISQKSLKHHIKQCHEEVNTPTFQCYHCNKIVKRRRNLIFHLREWHTEGDKLFHCDSCTYRTNIRQVLENHVYRLHVPNDQKPSFKCKLCPHEVKFKGDLQAHVNRVHLGETETKKYDQLIHSKAKRFNCPKCTYQTYYKSTLKAHLKYHEDNFQSCPECFQVVQESNFYDHIKNHRRNKLKVKQKCPECGKEVFELNKHLLTHAQVRIQCSECSYSALKRRSLKKHIRKYHNYHKEQRNFICYHCNKEIVSRTGLIRHLRAVHTDDPCECHICGKKLKSEVYLSEHVRTVHGNVKWFECDLCPEETRFRTKQANNLKWHRVLHLNKNEVIMYKCEYCPYEAKVPGYLQKHFRKHHLKKFMGQRTHSI